MRRNRIKAVINVPRGGRPVNNDRPLTPISSNHEPPPSSSSSPSPLTNLNSPQSIIRSPSPLVSPKSVNGPGSTVDMLYPSLTLVKSPANHGKSPIPELLPMSPVSGTGFQIHRDRSVTPEIAIRSRSPAFPFSPGGIQRPSPSASPNSSNLTLLASTSSNSTFVTTETSKYFSASSAPVAILNSSNSPSTFTLGSGHNSRKQSPSPGPNILSSNVNRSNQIFFNTNSNSADSHEVARYMSQSSPCRDLVAIEHEPRSSITGRNSSVITPSSLKGDGAFSSVMKDHAHSIFTDSTLLRQRLQKPSPSLTVSKFHTLRKEFLAKSATPERKQLTMLHFAFWNPPSDKEKKGGRPSARNGNRASSVCSNRSVRSNEEPNSRLAVKHESKGNINTRRATVEAVPLSRGDGSRNSFESHDEKSSDTVTSETSSQGSVHIGPRVKVGPDGQLIIDEQSLVVETSESQRAKKQLSEMETVSGADFIVGSSGLFRNKRKSKRGHDWTDKETIRFYRALSMCGTDFSMMTTLFPDRSRAEIKAKFKREDRKNPGQISLALSCQEFDPNEGITDDEQEFSEQNDDIVITANGIKKMKKKRPRCNSFIEQQLQEELDVDRTTSSAKPNNTPIFAETTKINSEIENKKSVPKRMKKPCPTGRTTATWKSNLIIDEAGEAIKMKKERSKADIQQETATIDVALVSSNVEKEKGNEPTISRKRKLSSSCPVEKISTTNANEYPTVKDSHCLEQIDILRFDESDLLGLKVVPVKSSDNNETPNSVGELVTLTPVNIVPNSSSSNSPINLDALSRRRRSRTSSNCSGGNSNVGVNKPDEYEVKSGKFLEIAEKLRTRKQALPANVKVPPYRVPGPGGGSVLPSKSKSPAAVIDIEIEIAL